MKLPNFYTYVYNKSGFAAIVCGNWQEQRNIHADEAGLCGSWVVPFQINKSPFMNSPSFGWSEQTGWTLLQHHTNYYLKATEWTCCVYISKARHVNNLWLWASMGDGTEDPWQPKALAAQSKVSSLVLLQLLLFSWSKSMRCCSSLDVF